MENNSRKSKDAPSAPWERSGSARSMGSASQIGRLIEENLRLTKEIHKMTKKINNFVLWSRIFGFIKILLIIAPIILGVIYFKPMLNLFDNAFAPYKELLNMENGQTGGGTDLGGIDFDRLSPELKKLLGK